MFVLNVLGLYANGSKIYILSPNLSKPPTSLPPFPSLSFRSSLTPSFLYALPPSLSSFLFCFKHSLSIHYMLVTVIGTSHAWSYSHCTLVSNSVLNRRKERLREVVQLAKGQTARKYRSRFGASYPLKSFHTFSCCWEITDCFLNMHTAFPLAALRMMFPLFCQNSTHSSRWSLVDRSWNSLTGCDVFSFPSLIAHCISCIQFSACTYLFFSYNSISSLR